MRRRTPLAVAGAVMLAVALLGVIILLALLIQGGT